MDLLGTSRIITISGEKTGTVTQLRTFIEAIEALQNGKQTVLTLVSSWTDDNKTGLIQEFTHDKAMADESRVKYTLVFAEGDVL